MKELRFLLLSMAICLASGVKAQFYDSADDIYYYVESYTEVEEKTQVYWNGMPTARWEKTGKVRKENANEGSESVMIFNFDGMKAAELTGYLGGEKIYDVKKRMQENPSYYEDKVETTDYK
jgi:hypothetical protein